MPDGLILANVAVYVLFMYYTYVNYRDLLSYRVHVIRYHITSYDLYM